MGLRGPVVCASAGVVEASASGPAATLTLRPNPTFRYASDTTILDSMGDDPEDKGTHPDLTLALTLTFMQDRSPSPSSSPTLALHRYTHHLLNM